MVLLYIPDCLTTYDLPVVHRALFEQHRYIASFFFFFNLRKKAKRHKPQLHQGSMASGDASHNCSTVQLPRKSGDRAGLLDWSMEDQNV